MDRPRGACGAVRLNLDGPGEPDQICVFGGSEGTHDRGTFLNTTWCYDRKRDVFSAPFGELPFPGDHLNAVHVPAGECGQERILILNFRTAHYGPPRAEVLALDLRRDRTGALDFGAAGPEWYLFSNDTSCGASCAARDAAGMVLSPDGRFLLNFGGVHYPDVAYEVQMNDHYSTRYTAKGLYTTAQHFYHAEIFDEARALDLCSGRWVGGLGRLKHKRYAIQSCSDGRQVFSCGGEMLFGRLNPTLTDRYGNGRDCEVHDANHLQRIARERATAAENHTGRGGTHHERWLRSAHESLPSSGGTASVAWISSETGFWPVPLRGRFWV